jgi:hypothetical protein
MSRQDWASEHYHKLWETSYTTSETR